MAVNNLPKKLKAMLKLSTYIKFGSMNFEGIKIFRKKEKIISPHL